MNIALILAGGMGSRMGLDIPKQYVEVNGKAVIFYCMDIFDYCEEVDAVQIVADEMWHEFILRHGSQKFRGFSRPGKNRQLSILNALEDICKYAAKEDVVVIHDAARPCVSVELIQTCLHAAAWHDGIIPVLPMKDTVYYSEDGREITSLLNRNTVFSGQAPEAFKLGMYYEANKKLLPAEILKINGSTEPAVMAGMDIALIAGEETNFKITTREDMIRFQQMMERKNESLCAACNQ